MQDRGRPSKFHVARSIEACPETCRGGSVAIGNFDGVHLGHRKVLDRAIEFAVRKSVPAVVLTFEPHPRSFFQPEKPVFRLTPRERKAQILGELGFNCVIEQAFDADFARLPANAFVESLLVTALRARHVAVGADFHFGHKRSGTPSVLQEEAQRLGFDVTRVEPVAADDGEIISSSRIRAALSSGDVQLANRLLGRCWRVEAPVQSGKQIGRTLGFPTANLHLPPETDLALGIYAIRAVLPDGSIHDGVASYGRRPTFDNGAVILEVNLFDFAGDLYGERLAVDFHAFLRGEARFDSAEALVAQMNVDAQNARKILRGQNP